MKQWFQNNWLQLIVIIGIGIIIYFVFHKSPDVSEVNQYKINELGEKIKQKDRVIDSLTKSLTASDDERVKQLDSLLQISIEANNKTIYELRRKKQAINTDSLSSQQLLQYFSTLR